MLDQIKNQLSKFHIIQKKHIYFLVLFLVIGSLVSLSYGFIFQQSKYNFVLGEQKENLKTAQNNYESIRLSAIRSETIIDNDKIADENLAYLELVNAEVIKNYSQKIITYSEERKYHYDITQLEEYLAAINDFYKALKISGDRGPDKMVDKVDEEYANIKRYI